MEHKTLHRTAAAAGRQGEEWHLIAVFADGEAPTRLLRWRRRQPGALVQRRVRARNARFCYPSILTEQIPCRPI